MMFILISRPFWNLPPILISHLMPIPPTLPFLFTDYHQEAYFEGGTQAWSRDGHSGTSQGVVQAFGRGQEEAQGCRQAQGSSQEDYYRNQGSAQEGELSCFFPAILAFVFTRADS
jgi:hypothetical protein